MGKQGKGNGAAAAALKTEPTELTTLATKQNGKYPYLPVYNIVRDAETFPAYGAKEMPMWIRYFAPRTKGDTALWCKLRVSNLT